MKKFLYFLSTIIVLSIFTGYSHKVEARVCIVDNMADCPAPNLGCDSCTTNWSCSTGGTCAGASCPKNNSAGDPTQAGCNPTCPSGWVKGRGAGECKVACSPCNNYDYCIPQPTTPPPPPPPPPACPVGQKKGEYCDKFTTPGTCFIVETVWNNQCGDDYRRTNRSCPCDTPPPPPPPSNPPPPGTTPPPPPPGNRCDRGCGVCGYRNSAGQCTEDARCCHKACVQNNACVVVYDGTMTTEPDSCANNAQCVSPTPTPTPTPTPDFNPAMCKCDGIKAENLFAGSKATITAFGKVEGADVTKAKITSMKYFMVKGKTVTGNIIARSNAIGATVISREANKVRYQTQWQPQIPSNPAPGSSYTIWAQITCEPARATALRYSPLYETKTAVLGAQTEEKKGLIDSAIDSIFGSKEKKIEATPVPSTPAGEVLQANTIQIDTFYPAQKVQKLCSMVRFEFSDGTQ